MTSPRLTRGKKVGRERLVVWALATMVRIRLDGLVGGRFLLLLVDPACLLADVGDLGLVGLMPADSAVLRKVVSCIAGEQAATMMPSAGR